MMAANIVVTISPTGDTSVEVEGGSGKSCTNISSLLEQALGSSKGTEYKQEFYQQDQRISQSN
jgi:hypothetical protein